MLEHWVRQVILENASDIAWELQQPRTGVIQYPEKMVWKNVSGNLLLDGRGKPQRQILEEIRHEMLQMSQRMNQFSSWLEAILPLAIYFSARDARQMDQTWWLIRYLARFEQQEIGAALTIPGLYQAMNALRKTDRVEIWDYVAVMVTQGSKFEVSDVRYRPRHDDDKSNFDYVEQ